MLTLALLCLLALAFATLTDGPAPCADTGRPVWVSGPARPVPVKVAPAVRPCDVLADPPTPLAALRAGTLTPSGPIVYGTRTVKVVCVYRPAAGPARAIVRGVDGRGGRWSVDAGTLS